MKALLWTLQIVLAMHTAMGAVWKFSHPAQFIPSLKVIPPALWVGLSVFELLCVLCLLLPAAQRTLAVLAPLAALGIAAEMLLFCGLHLHSGDPQHGNPVYWLIVAALCGFIAYGRFMLKPL